jgi:hypothetical protein
LAGDSGAGFVNNFDGAGLWPLVAQSFDEPDAGAEFKTIELLVGNAVAVKEYPATIDGAQKSVSLASFELFDESGSVLGGVFLDIVVLFLNDLLELSSGDIKGVAQHHIQRVVHSALVGFAFDDDFVSGGDAEIDPDAIRVARTLV